ncbi:ATP-dependent helicase HrpB [Alteromonas sp. A081]|uniref:ATP-dependent helicase HrpB n=1 Tax=Alteromonas sp. A081 TaxID=3410269 RepID=UPI003B985E62
MLDNLSHLPAFSLIDGLAKEIATNNIVIGAPPGAGKSTVLPLSLLHSILDGKILLMQPRRVVVRNLADYLAKQLGESVGQTIGYRIRGESKVSAQTRIELITEGILTRMIQTDPELTGVSAIVFDEFHERSIHSDFGLALALEVQAGLRDDLRILVMSATLALEPLSRLLEKHSALPISHLNTQGRAYPVAIFYYKDTFVKDIVANTSQVVRSAVARHEGDVLVFLPSRATINAVARELNSFSETQDVGVYPLYGALGKSAQQKALVADSEGRRKVILATNIAETSLTIEGVKVVVDSLWENSAQYHAASDMTQLTMQRISQASATQRAGRAGRVSEGVCYRLCSQESFDRLERHSAAQIEREDISSFLLDTYAWGSKPHELALLTPPTANQEAIAQKKLARIQCIDESLSITAYGKQVAELPCQPHLANLLLVCKKGIPSLEKSLQRAMRTAAPFVVALSESRSIGQNTTLVSELLRALSAAERTQITLQAKRYGRFVGIEGNGLSISALDDDAIGLCIAIAYPLQVAFLREAKSASHQSGKKAGGAGQPIQEYKLASGKGAQISGLPSTTPPQWLAVLHGQHIDNTVKIRQAQPISEPLLRSVFPNAFNQQRSIRLNRVSGLMEARTITGFYDIDLEILPVSKDARSKDSAYWEQATVEAWLGYLESLALKEWPLSEADWQWWRRVKLAAQCELPQPQSFDGGSPWPKSLTDVVHQAKEGLASHLARCSSLKMLHSLPWKAALNNGLTWAQQDALATLLPMTVRIPTGRDAALDYRESGDVVLSVKLTEMYSQSAPIVIGNGHITVVCELLSPAGRPLQTTSDLSTFWKGSYKEIQKEMKGRYPKHFWPDDPALAKPTSKIKKHL